MTCAHAGSFSWAPTSASDSDGSPAALLPIKGSRPATQMLTPDYLESGAFLKTEAGRIA